MVQVSYGDSAEFNALAFGPKHPGTLAFLENQVSSFSQTLTDAGRSFFSNARDVFEQFNGEEAMRLARAAVRKANSLFQRDQIRSIWELGELQQAPLTMQRWIMANPEVRQMYQDQRCDGYVDTYIDVHPGTIGSTHYDYRRAVNGMVMDDDEDDWVCRFYPDELLEGDKELSLDEKIDIQTTWDIVAALMKAGGEDPTSPFANKL
jgi:hypothetical protein